MSFKSTRTREGMENHFAGLSTGNFVKWQKDRKHELVFFCVLFASDIWPSGGDEVLLARWEAAKFSFGLYVTNLGLAAVFDKFPFAF